MKKIQVIIGRFRNPPQVERVFSLPDYSIFVPNSPLNTDVSGDGNPATGVPVELKAFWNNANQVWRFQPA